MKHCQLTMIISQRAQPCQVSSGKLSSMIRFELRYEWLWGLHMPLWPDRPEAEQPRPVAVPLYLVHYHPNLHLIAFPETCKWYESCASQSGKMSRPGNGPALSSHGDRFSSLFPGIIFHQYLVSTLCVLLAYQFLLIRVVKVRRYTSAKTSHHAQVS